jgi:hypothetical protein
MLNHDSKNLPAIVAFAVTIFLTGCGEPTEIAGVYVLEEQVGQASDRIVCDFRSDGTASWKLVTHKGDEDDSFNTTVYSSRGDWHVESGKVKYKAPSTSIQVGEQEPVVINTPQELTFTIEPNGDLVRESLQQERLIQQNK